MGMSVRAVEYRELEVSYKMSWLWLGNEVALGLYSDVNTLKLTEYASKAEVHGGF